MTEDGKIFNLSAADNNMKFNYNRDKAELLRVMKSKAEKKNIQITTQNNKISVSLKSGEFSNGEDSIPIAFHGRIEENDARCSLNGRFGYGFYLYTMVIVAAVLIAARLAWSIYQRQKSNILLCIFVSALLAIVIAVVQLKSKRAKQLITSFLNNLNIK